MYKRQHSPHRAGIAQENLVVFICLRAGIEGGVQVKKCEAEGRIDGRKGEESGKLGGEFFTFHEKPLEAEESGDDEAGRRPADMRVGQETATERGDNRGGPAALPLRCQRPAPPGEQAATEDFREETRAVHGPDIREGERPDHDCRGAGGCLRRQTRRAAARNGKRGDDGKNQLTAGCSEIAKGPGQQREAGGMVAVQLALRVFDDV